MVHTYISSEFLKILLLRAEITSSISASHSLFFYKTFVYGIPTSGIVQSITVSEKDLVSVFVDLIA